MEMKQNYEPWLEYITEHINNKPSQITYELVTLPQNGEQIPSMPNKSIDP